MNNRSFSAVDWDRLSPLREKGKVKMFVVFSLVHQLLTRSVGLEKLPNIQQNFDFIHSDFLPSKTKPPITMNHSQ